MSRPMLALCCFGLVACAADSGPRADPAATESEMVTRGLCERARADAIHDAFCGAAPPEIHSLHDLQSRLELDFGEPGPDTIDEGNTISGFGTYRGRDVVLLNTSTALAGRLVSTLNPRAIVLGEQSGFAFNRGTQQVELVSRDRDHFIFNFYLPRFQQACNTAPEGCSPGDLYTPRIESDWTSVRIEDDEALKNTASDCRQCHQRARERPLLLMRELDGPWTHFFMPDQDPMGGSPEASGVDIVRAYHRAKGEERYSGLPWEAIRATVGFTLELAVDRPQPLVFDGSQILNERWPWSKESGFADEPVLSASWYAEYEAFKRGEQLALPYFDPFPSDPDKLANMTLVYQRYRNGEIAAEQARRCDRTARCGPDAARPRAVFDWPGGCSQVS